MATGNEFQLTSKTEEWNLCVLKAPYHEGTWAQRDKTTWTVNQSTIPTTSS